MYGLFLLSINDLAGSWFELRASNESLWSWQGLQDVVRYIALRYNLQALVGYDVLWDGVNNRLRDVGNGRTIGVCFGFLELFLKMLFLQVGCFALLAGFSAALEV